MRFDPFSFFVLVLSFSVAMSVCMGACSNRTADELKAKAARAPVLPPSDDPLDQQLKTQAAKYAGGMIVHDNAFRGELPQGGQQDFLVVLPGGHCYKAIGVGDIHVNDLDLSLVDPNGSQIQQDVARDALPVLGMDAPLCLQEAGAHRLHVRMRDGEGSFLVRFFKTDE